MVEANTFGSDYDTTLIVVTGSPGNFTVIACNNNSGVSGSELQSHVTFNAVAGETYYFMIGSNGSDGGSLVFNANDGIDLTPPEVTIVAPQPNEALQDGVVLKGTASDFTVSTQCPFMCVNQMAEKAIPLAMMI